MKKRNKGRQNRDFTIKAVIFDVGGVLNIKKKKSSDSNGINSSVHQGVARKLGISMDHYFDSIDTSYAGSIIGEVSKKQLLRVMSNNFQYPVKKIESLYKETFKKNFRQNKRLHGFAVSLKNKGYKIAILSDQWPLSKDAFILREYYQNFNPVIVSCDVGLRKPDERIYRLTLEKLKIKGRKAREVVFIDNREWNLKPAEKIGMKTVLFKNNRQAINDLRKLGVE